MNMKDIIEVMQISMKYVKDGEQYVQAEHDEIHTPLPNDTKISEEDESRLNKLGAHKGSSGYWYVFT